MRYFLGLDLPAEAKQQIGQWQAQQPVMTGKPVPPQNYHITLVFIGNLDDLKREALQQRIRHIDVGQFECTLDTAGYFRRPQVAWLGCQHMASQLALLVKQLRHSCDAIELKVDQQPYIPHLTLTRKAHHPPPLPPTCGFSWRVTEFCLFESVSTKQGVRYLIRARWPLIGVDDDPSPVAVKSPVSG